MSTTLPISVAERWRFGGGRAATHALIALPPVVVAWVLYVGLRADAVAVDLMNAYLPAARALVDGLSPYGLDPLSSGRAFVYPPLAGWLAAPFLLLPPLVASLLATLASVAAVAGILWLMGVRDWRCYSLPLLWFPVYAALQTANAVLLVALLCAVAWRWRGSAVTIGVALGAAIALKLIALPLLLFLLLTRRTRGASIAVVSASLLVLAPWAAIGFRGLADYPELLLSLSELERGHAYTIGALAAPATGWVVAQGATYALGLLLVVLMIRFRHDERLVFIIAVALMLALSPIVWMAYFVLLLLVLPLAWPSLAAAWLLPLVFWASPMAGSGSLGDNGAPWQTGLALIVGAAALVLSGLRVVRAPSASSRASRR